MWARTPRTRGLQGVRFGDQALERAGRQLIEAGVGVEGLSPNGGSGHQQLTCKWVGLG
jgi:hypothetical protein